MYCRTQQDDESSHVQRDDACTAPQVCHASRGNVHSGSPRLHARARWWSGDTSSEHCSMQLWIGLYVHASSNGYVGVHVHAYTQLAALCRSFSLLCSLEPVKKKAGSAIQLLTHRDLAWILSSTYAIRSWFWSNMRYLLLRSKILVVLRLDFYVYTHNDDDKFRHIYKAHEIKIVWIH